MATKPAKTVAPKPAPHKPAASGQIVATQSFSGPIPPPAILEGYERLVPGAAARILNMAEAEAAHLRQIERDALAHQTAIIQRGQYFGLAVAALAIGASVVALFLGQPWVAGVLGGTTVVGLVAAFVLGRSAP